MYLNIDNQTKNNEINDFIDKNNNKSWISSKFIGITILFTLAVIGSFAVTSFDNYSIFKSNIKVEDVLSLKSIPSDTVYNNYSEDDKQELFKLYLKEYNLSFDNVDEYYSRYEVFKSNLLKIDERNNNERSSVLSISNNQPSKKSAPPIGARHGITKFSTYTEEELLKIKMQIDRSTTKRAGSISPKVVSSYTSATEESTTVDWTDVLTTTAKDQGYCGGCWSFSAVAQIESDAIRAGLLTTSDSLSVQQVLSCQSSDWQCMGGFTEDAFQYAMDNGLQQESTYPYTSFFGVAPPCTSNSDKYVIKVDNFYQLTSEDSMVDYVLTTGPLSVCIDSTAWSTYIDGILSVCGKRNVDHCVQIVGVSTENSYWKIRNTWGKDWGENGFIRLALGSDTCAITTDPIYTSVTSISSN